VPRLCSGRGQPSIAATFDDVDTRQRIMASPSPRAAIRLTYHLGL
jgi:hypothetical protein